MRLALALAERGRGATGANPLVGAVVVKRGRVVGRGWHSRWGGPHAEAIALARAGDRARGSDLYVTLEPCAHLGKTAPCTRQIIAAGVRRVVVAMRDPAQGGRGLGELRRARVAVRMGVLVEAARVQNREFLLRLATGRPAVTVKLAQTLDGRIADARGSSKWITSPAARRLTRRLRGEADAVMVGGRTAREDDPKLTAGRRAPLKVIVDSRARLSPGARLLATGRTVVAATRAAPARRVAALELRGAEVWRLPARGGRVDLAVLLRTLLARGVGSVFCEGGAELAGALLDRGLVDRVAVVIAPRLLGGPKARPAVLGRGRALPDAIPLKEVSVTRIGRDTLITGWVRRKGTRV